MYDDIDVVSESVDWWMAPRRLIFHWCLEIFGRFEARTRALESMHGSALSQGLAELQIVRERDKSAHNWTVHDVAHRIKKTVTTTYVGFSMFARTEDANTPNPTRLRRLCN